MEVRQEGAAVDHPAVAVVVSFGEAAVAVRPVEVAEALLAVAADRPVVRAE